MEMSVEAKSVCLGGFTIRRPRKLQYASPCLLVSACNVTLCGVTVNNDGGNDVGVSVSDNGRLQLYGSSIKGCTTAGISANASFVTASHTYISENSGSGITAVKSELYFEDSFIVRNSQYAFHLTQSFLALSHCDLRTQSATVFLKDDRSRLIARRTLGNPDCVKLLGNFPWPASMTSVPSSTPVSSPREKESSSSQEMNVENFVTDSEEQLAKKVRRLI
jgi:hypothetical protein